MTAARSSRVFILNYPQKPTRTCVAPVAMLGVRLGSRIHTSLTPMQARRAIGLLLVAAGGILLVRTLL